MAAQPDPLHVIAADMAAWSPVLIAQPKLLSPILLHGTTDGDLKTRDISKPRRLHSEPNRGEHPQMCCLQF